MAMKGKRYADVDAFQKASTAIFNAIPKDDLKKSFDNLLDQIVVFSAKATNKMFAKENHFFLYSPGTFEFHLAVSTLFRN